MYNFVPCDTGLCKGPIRGVCVFYFSNFAFGFQGFHLEKLKIIQFIFEKDCERKFIGEQSIEVPL